MRTLEKKERRARLALVRALRGLRAFGFEMDVTLLSSSATRRVYTYATPVFADVERAALAYANEVSASPIVVPLHVVVANDDAANDDDDGGNDHQ
jgi:hypothetical protein